MTGRVSLDIPNDLFATITALARAERRSRAMTVAILLEEALTARGHTAAPPPPIPGQTTIDSHVQP